MIYILGNVLYVASFIVVSHLFVGFNWRKSYRNCVIAILIMLFVSALEIGTSQPLIFLPIQVVEITLILSLIYNEKLKRIVAYVILFTVIHAILIQIIDTFLISIQTIVSIEMDTNKIDCAVLLLFILLFGCLAKKYTLLGTGKIKKKYIVLLISLLMLDSGILTVLGDYINDLKYTFMSSMLYITIMISFLLQATAIVYFISSRDIFRERERYVKKYMNAQQSYYEDISERDIKTRKFRHDIKNHMNLLAQLCKENDITKIEDYLKEINIHINEFGSKIDTNNRIADAIFDSYHKECEKEKIELRVRGHFTSECKISTYDMCVILSNLLDNALEAEKESQGNVISVNIRNAEEHKIVILIENDTNRKIESQTVHLITTKKNKLEHGFGLENVEDCVRRNNGYININTEEGKFRVWICMDDTGV